MRMGKQLDILHGLHSRGEGVEALFEFVDAASFALSKSAIWSTNCCCMRSTSWRADVATVNMDSFFRNTKSSTC